MAEVVTVGLDIAKAVFQVHGVDVGGEVAVRRQLRRAQVLTFFANLPAAWSASKPALQRIIGLARSARRATR